jgi:hypothetical protein
MSPDSGRLSRGTSRRSTGASRHSAYFGRQLLQLGTPPPELSHAAALNIANSCSTGVKDAHAGRKFPSSRVQTFTQEAV